MPTPEDYELEYSYDMLAVEIPEDASVIDEIYKTASAEFASYEAGDLRSVILEDGQTRSLGIVALFRGMEDVFQRHAPDTEDEAKWFEFRHQSVAGKSTNFSRSLFIALRLAQENPSVFSDELKKKHKELFATHFKD